MTLSQQRLMTTFSVQSQDTEDLRWSPCSSKYSQNASFQREVTYPIPPCMALRLNFAQDRIHIKDMMAGGYQQQSQQSQSSQGQASSENYCTIQDDQHYCMTLSSGQLFMSPCNGKGPAMVVPEKNEILYCYSDMDELFYEEDCPYFKSSLHDPDCSMNCSVCQLGIQLNITNQKTPSMTFKKVVMIVVAVEKMKNTIRPSASLFMDEDLQDILNNIIVEEAIRFENFNTTYAADSGYAYFSSSSHKIFDTSNKSFVLHEFHGSAQLVASHLQGSNSKNAVKLNMALYSSQPSISSSRGIPVALGIVGKNLYLSSVMAGGRAELQLEKVNDIIKEIRNDSLLRFLFFMSNHGSSALTTFTFESVNCPNWYISTSKRSNEPVKMAKYEEQSAIIELILMPDEQ
uniref:Interleukin-1 n=1 Tax=Geotrypetes seraphini TaxID=260995 RepID=A0A6P8RKU8_GEOSA|nr:interleukin-1 beta-like [Geotrypetes seraphini]